ncbi:Uncharacterised protein [Legionella busanensis]|uniref:Uncharacterized protein n=1 Tax=Legionella busanensis TaxID=190655 RepID=A0A378JI18_9GAMM|nr:hypothetical protein [Legionella busanensis]STX50956.1 Uncharacterised protein [Legionella busanensis]
MPTNAKTKGKRSEERSNALDSNPCGICRAMGSPICKGHGGGGGGGGDKGETAQNGSAPTPEYKPTNLEVRALSSYLEHSEVWQTEDDFLYNFNNGSAVFSMGLDLAKGLIHFEGDESLDDTDAKDLNELYDKIEEELKLFTQEVKGQNISVSRKGNDLKISIPDQKLYDQFVTKLLNKNLIPNNNYNADLAYKPNPLNNQKVDVKDMTDSTYKSPNPFDISKGPRPTNDFKE